jgi:hypothetical protein
LLDAAPVKRALRVPADPLILVISGEIYSSVVRHGYDGIDQHAFTLSCVSRSRASATRAGSTYLGQRHNG